MNVEIVSLLNVVDNAAEDLETMAAIMMRIGDLPHENVTPDWLAWFGRQLELVSVNLVKAAKEVR